MRKFLLFLFLCLGLSCVTYFAFADTGVTSPGVAGKIGTNDLQPGAVTEPKLSIGVQVKLNASSGGDTSMLVPKSDIDTDSTMVANSDTKVPSQAAVKTALGTKQNTIAYTPEDAANKDTDDTFTANSDVKYPSQKAVKTALGTKQNTISGTPGKIAIFTGAAVIGDGSATDTVIKTRHFRIDILDPNTLVDTDIVITPKLDMAITITNIEVSCDTNPDTEIVGDLKYADAFIGFASPTVINDFDTAAGVRSDNSITSASVAAGKCIYLSFDTTPVSAIKQIAFDITYIYQ